MKPVHIFTLVLLFVAGCGQPSEKESPFSFVRDDYGLSLFENGKLIYYFRQEPKLCDSLQTGFNNYFHPLTGINGETLTEEFPASHPHHRGMFWGWHQVMVKGKSVGDQWIMRDIHMIVTDKGTKVTPECAIFNWDADWSSPAYENGSVFLKEKNTLKVYPDSAGVRIMDLRIGLLALTDSVRIGGSPYIRGYGGLSLRLRNAQQIAFTSSGGKVIALPDQTIAGPWMDFSEAFEGKDTSGITILTHPSNPGLPAPWILRCEPGMQNPVFPGNIPTDIPANEPLYLCYRLVIHKGGAKDLPLAEYQSAYEKLKISELF